MAATKYQVLYRFMNDTLGTPVTNNSNTKFEPTFEFYTDPDHRIFSSNSVDQNEEMQKQQDMITYANSSANEKHDMLFVFNGTKKIWHKRWVGDQIGYVVRDWQSIRSKIGNQGDYSKEFTTINGVSPEDGGTVVCTASIMQKYFKAYSQNNFGGATTSDIVQQAIIESTIFKLKDSDWKSHAVKGENGSSSGSYYTMPGAAGYAADGHWRESIAQAGSYITLYTSNIIIDPEDGIDYITDYSVYYRTGYSCGSPTVSQDTTTLPIAWISNAKMYKSVSVNQSDLETTTIPGHYEDATDAPYAIKDQYARIENSPWVVNCTVGSFEAALIKAKKLVDMIGIENVKIIKVVPFDQRIKVK